MSTKLTTRQGVGSGKLGSSLNDIFDDRDDDMTESMHSSITSLDSVQAPINRSGRMPMGRLRQSFTNAIASPVKLAKDKISSASPRRLSQSMRNSFTKTGESARGLLISKKEPVSWRDELEIPPDATKEEALAFLLCKELEDIDL